jgi:hypothetical protein
VGFGGWETAGGAGAGELVGDLVFGQAGPCEKAAGLVGEIATGAAYMGG